MPTPTTTDMGGGHQLTSEQAHSLFNLLSHEQSQYEFSSLKVPGRVSASGAPFVPEPALPPQRPSPILSVLFRKLALTLPGFRDTKPELWSDHVQSVLEDMAAQDLSDSYDKGSISKRKTVGYAIVVIAEYAARGLLGGMPTSDTKAKDSYDPSSIDDIMVAWNSVREGFVYGNDMEELVEWAAKTDQLEGIPSRFQAAHQFASITFAAFLHYLLALNPAGPTILRLMRRVHALLPYGIVRQALRVGNAATITNAVLKIFLYRAPSLRGFFRGGKDSRGSNMLQSIISSVLGADKTALERKISELKGGTPEQHSAIDEYVTCATRSDRLTLRAESAAAPTSLIATILKDSGVDPPATQAEHDVLQDRLSLGLAIRDRERLVAVLSGRATRPSYYNGVGHNDNGNGRTSPAPSTSSLGSTKSGKSTADDLGIESSDHLSAGIQEVARAFEPVLRRVHRAGDLPRALSDLQAFLDALLALPTGASVGAYARVVDVHQRSLHRFLHALAQDSELRAWYMSWYRTALDAYRAANPMPGGGAGAMTGVLEGLLASLNEEDRRTVLAEADAYAAHLRKLEHHSRERMRSLLADDSKEDAGPGVWLAVWQGMVDRTAVTPASVNGPVRYGAEGGVQKASAADGAEGADGIGIEVGGDGMHTGTVGAKLGLEGNPMPDMTKTWKLLGERWEDELIKLNMK